MDCLLLDPLLHEERLPCANNAADGWTGLQQNVLPSPAIDDREEAAWEAQWQQWWSRHAISAASDFDQVAEPAKDDWKYAPFSWGHSRAVGTPHNVSFIASGPEAARLRPKDVAEPLYEVVKASAEYLSRILPDSSRLADLKRGIRRVATPRMDGRLMWLAGAGPDNASVQRGWQRLKRWFSELPQAQRSTLMATTSTSPLVVDGSCHAALMYASVTPTITKGDMLTLAGAMVALSSMDPEAEKLAAISRAVPLVTSDRPWFQAYELAEDIHDQLGGTDTVDIDATLRELGVEVVEIELDDTSVRGVAVAGPHHRPGIAWKSSCPFNQNPEGRRFTFAHELCHILFDRDVGRRLTIVSGRWAPLGIEQRANAFAAMLLMPTELVKSAVGGLDGPVVSASDVAVVSTRLQTGFAATLWHLHNLGIIDDFDRQRIQAECRLAGSR